MIEFNSDFAVTSDTRSNVFIAGGLSGLPNAQQNFSDNLFMFNMISDLPKFKTFLDLRCIEIRDPNDVLVCAKLVCPRVKPLLSILENQNQIYLVVMGGKSFNTAFEKTVEMFPISTTSVAKEGQ